MFGTFLCSKIGFKIRFKIWFKISVHEKKQEKDEQEGHEAAHGTAGVFEMRERRQMPTGGIHAAVIGLRVVGPIS